MFLGPKDPELIACHDQLDAVEEELTRLLTSCSTEAFQQRPEEKRWSPSEVLEHLIVTTELYLPPLDRALDRGHRKQITGRSEGIGYFEKLFISALEPPPRRKFKAPGRFQPPNNLEGATPANSLERFKASQVALVKRIARADGLAISRLKIASPISRLLRFRVLATFKILSTHQMRHLWQIRRILAIGETVF